MIILRPGANVLYDCDLEPLLKTGCGAFIIFIFPSSVLYFPGPGTLFLLDSIIFL